MRHFDHSRNQNRILIIFQRLKVIFNPKKIEKEEEEKLNVPLFLHFQQENRVVWKEPTLVLE